MRIEAPESHYDVIVVGGGLVGASFAGLLSAKEVSPELSILVVEAVTPGSDQQPSFDARSTALAWNSRQLFEDMGLWPSLQEDVCAIRDIHVSDQGHFGTVLINSAEHDQEALGYVVENRCLGAGLSSLLAERPGLSFLAPATIQSLRPRAEGMDMEIRSDDRDWQVSASLVVLCDGARSPLSEQLGIEQRRKQYAQQALIANIAFSNPHDNVAYERFTESGPLAVLPLADYGDSPRGALIWTLKASEADHFRSMDEAALIERLQQSFGHRLGRITRIGERLLYPLQLSRAAEQIRPGLALLGNVAQTLHPVAGQGLNLALRDAAALASVLGGVRSSEGAQAEIGSMRTLQCFVDGRQADQRRAMGLTDNMIKLFSTGRASHVLARKLGMLSIDLMPPLRRGFARQAMGLWR